MFSKSLRRLHPSFVVRSFDSDKLVLGYFASNLLLLMSTLENVRFAKVANCIELNYDCAVSKE